MLDGRSGRPVTAGPPPVATHAGTVDVPKTHDPCRKRACTQPKTTLSFMCWPEICAHRVLDAWLGHCVA